MTLTASVDA
jgi:hypothetical protein